jgi:serine/threonine protein kinase
MATEIPGYEIIEPLGGGALTQVVAARQRGTGSLCAVKRIRPNCEDLPTAIKLIQREARIGLRVRHPHLVGFRHAQVTRPPYFLVMDFLAGESLRRRLRRDYRIDAASTIWIVRQIAEALAALHGAGFVHGDVKPDNVRLIDDGTAVLIDLGFAHRPGENAVLRRRGYILGTANYLAPELCSGEPDADTASDLFSLGVTMFEMVAGELPYPLGNVEETLRRHAWDSPSDIRSLQLPSGLAGLVGRLLARQPAKRPRATTVVQQLITLEIANLSRRRSA